MAGAYGSLNLVVAWAYWPPKNKGWFGSSPTVQKILDPKLEPKSTVRKLEELPDIVGNLYNLQTLELVFCIALKTLRVTIRRLINLKHLNLGGCDSLKVPKEIGRLKNLETLEGLTLYGDVDENKGLIKLGDLGNLDQLRESIYTSVFKGMPNRAPVRASERGEWKSPQAFVCLAYCTFSGVRRIKAW
ncbi:unnamed protein product [Prunus armeniaca]|uniref:Disease resistance R13L4/SHOC-2-like LRR domain-containing protein n=1 Tax=Prunus armeniaca TaxID=36596 RepID=A0A6J5WBK2_PRUAR|nr:unnamed protein product [Prunus armeniaca]